MTTRGRGWLVVALLTAATTVVAWSLGVSVTAEVDQPDFLIRPIDALIDRRATITVAALLVGGAVAIAHARERRRGRALPDDVALPVVMIGVVIGLGYSVVTAPTVGANIGGGLVILGAPIVLAVLAVVAVRSSRRHRSSAT